MQQSHMVHQNYFLEIRIESFTRFVVGLRLNYAMSHYSYIPLLTLLTLCLLLSKKKQNKILEIDVYSAA